MKLPRALTLPRPVRELARRAGAGVLALLRDPKAYAGSIAGVLSGLGSIAVAVGYAHADEVLSDPTTHARVVVALTLFGGALSVIAGVLQNKPPAAPEQ